MNYDIDIRDFLKKTEDEIALLILLGFVTVLIYVGISAIV